MTTRSTVNWLAVGACLLLALVINGGLPGLLLPTTGQSIWLGGFAQSIAEGPLWSLKAETIGGPEPASISFGLSGAFPISLLMRIGVSGSIAFTAVYAVYLVVAFWGAFRFARFFENSVPVSALCAAAWLTAPMVWWHAHYSFLAIGIALLPLYLYVCIALFRSNLVVAFPVHLAATMVSVFTDGYTFLMNAVAACLLCAYFSLRRETGYLTRSACLVASFVVSYLCYRTYIGPSLFPREPLEFFRAWGADLSYLALPSMGVVYVADLLGLSVHRSLNEHFGDDATYMPTFAAAFIFVGVIALFCMRRSRQFAIVFVLMAGFGFYMSLGPSLKIDTRRPAGIDPAKMTEIYAPIPTGSAFISQNVPGFYNMRASYRWAALGMLGMWACVVAFAGQAGRFENKKYVLLGALVVFNVPNVPGRYADLAKAKAKYETIQADMTTYKIFFNRSERVAFLPRGNDFLVNLLAPLWNIQTYNIGGDKNITMAKRHWPSTMDKFHYEHVQPNFSADVGELLLAGDADAVVVPYMSLHDAAFIWPHPLDRLEELQPHLKALEEASFLEVTSTEYFAIVRLKPDIAQHPCRTTLIRDPGALDGILRVPEISAGAISFSRRDIACGAGWSVPEGWGRWTDGNRADLNFRIPERGDEALVLEFDVEGFVPGDAEQKVSVSVNGQASQQWKFTPQANRRIERISVPAQSADLNLKFDIENARSAKSAGVGGDTRELGLAVHSICLTASEKACLSRQ